jgi:PadR family transcriptional regulator, regulatory protein PadR
VGGEGRPGPRVTFQTAMVLREMLAAPTKPSYGLELSQETGLPTGTIYPILARLEVAGWIHSGWENIDPVVEGRPRRRLYYLTGEGASLARSALTDMQRKLGPAGKQSGPGRLRPEGGVL